MGSLSQFQWAPAKPPHPVAMGEGVNHPKTDIVPSLSIFGTRITQPNDELQSNAKGAIRAPRGVRRLLLRLFLVLLALGLRFPLGLGFGLSRLVRFRLPLGPFRLGLFLLF